MENGAVRYKLAGMKNDVNDIKAYIQEVPDFPKPGISFKDISPLIGSAPAFAAAIDRFEALYRGKGIEAILAPEARGFIWGGALGLKLGAGLVPARKPGKLPRKTVVAKYDLEYGTDELHVHADAIRPGQNVLILDDVLATGGTALALAKLAEQCKAKVAGLGFVIELGYLNGIRKIAGYDVQALATY